MINCEIDINFALEQDLKKKDGTSIKKSNRTNAITGISNFF